MKAVQVLYLVLWIGVGVYVWHSGPWSHVAQGPDETPDAHSAMFHMHRPLHDGGKVAMVGQYHLELVSNLDGTHRLWVSNAVREELNVENFEGTLRIEPEVGDPTEIVLSSTDSALELVASSTPLSGQVWISVTGHLGSVAAFDDVRFFWDYAPDFNQKTPLGLDPMIPIPGDNQLTDARVELGRALFFDPLLSVDGTVSCASCHRPEYAYAEPLKLAKGVSGRIGRRNTPTVLNTAYLTSLFWDGRASSLEEQAVAPIVAHAEMGIADVTALTRTLEPKYGSQMREAFGRPLSLHAIGMAIASFERTLLSGDSDFDRFEAGQTDAISIDAHRGRSLFFGRAHCGDCHTPPLFTDLAFHNLGVGWTDSGPSDAGRFEATGDLQHRGAFKTPSLRDVVLTAPYMHDGSIPTLGKVVEFYNAGCRPNPSVSPHVGPLGLNERERADLVAFLETLNGRMAGNEQAVSARSTTNSAPQHLEGG